METTRTSLVPLLPVIVQKLSTPQQAFLSRYIGLGIATGVYDAVAAAKIVYPRAKNHQVLALQTLNRRNIRRILDLHFQRSPREAVLADVTHTLKRARRRGSNMDVTVPALVRIAKALEALAGKAS